jgi:hypothetical protein
VVACELLLRPQEGSGVVDARGAQHRRAGGARTLVVAELA